LLKYIPAVNKWAKIPSTNNLEGSAVLAQTDNIAEPVIFL
jgi:hypothetical protein